jgi:pilus assembly protein CpaB
MRLATISVDPVSGGAGFVYPGDRVDVIITRDIPLSKESRMPVSEVLIPNVRVLAVNQKSTTQAGEGPTVPSTVSLEVNQLDVERLRLAENGNGRISIVLRSLKDKDNTTIARPSGIGDLSRVTPAAYFPILYDNLNSYTPQMVTAAPGKEKEVASAAPGNAAPAVTSGNDEGNTVDIIRGVKKESVQIPSSSSTY